MGGSSIDEARSTASDNAFVQATRLVDLFTSNFTISAWLLSTASKRTRHSTARRCAVGKVKSTSAPLSRNFSTRSRFSWKTAHPNGVVMSSSPLNAAI
ncbi:hypothetical protein TMatcc_002402 [Talaromyces marneffei ATCC 18224]